MTAQGRDIAVGEYSVKAVDVTANVSNPQSPAGSANVSASTIIAAGFEFSTVNLDASGDEKAHTVHLTARGQPLSAEVRVQGAREGKDGWAGTFEQLDLEAVGVSPVALREPVKVSYNPRSFSVSQSCLAGEQISACVTAAQNEQGEITANYALEHLPLGLVAALAAPSLPVRIEAVIEGNGNIRRAPEGALFGEAHLSSTSGRISEAARVAARGCGRRAAHLRKLQSSMRSLRATPRRARVSTSFEWKRPARSDKRCSPNLSGSARHRSTAGRGSRLPDLSPVGLFVPQLANMKGAAEANVAVMRHSADAADHGQRRTCAISKPKCRRSASSCIEGRDPGVA